MRLGALALLSACVQYDLSPKDDDNNNPNDGDDDTVVVTGPQPDIEVDPSSIDFGFFPTECPSEPLQVTLSNVGDEPLDVESLELVGDGVFTLSGEGRVLAPGASYQVSVSFDPTAWTPFAAELVVISNDPDEGALSVPVEGEGAEDAIYEERFTQTAPSTVDVLWIIDNSGSMSGVVDDLSTNMPTFINSFLGLGLDWQMAVVTTDMDDPAHQGHLQGLGVISPSTTADPVGAFTAAAAVGDGGSGDERARDAAYAALTDPLLSAGNGALVRPDGTLALIVITDEEDSSRDISKEAFADWLDRYKGDPDLTSFSAMAGPESSGLFDMGCQDLANDITAESSVDYPYLVQETGGFYTEICDMNFNEVLTYLSYTAAGMLTRWQLAHVPSNIGHIDVTVHGDDVPYNALHGFTYEGRTNSVVFHGSWIPQPLDEVQIRYPYDAGC
ncbi:MAG: choice-of-anchor D domain-containing protein [Deltaproteobacteria bacterium]|nr:choice-of-anchor D domain-containing protein [Deltaproteobacteria bacterium]